MLNPIDLRSIHAPEVETIAAVLVEVVDHGQTRWSACERVAIRIRLHPRTVARIVDRRALRPP